MIDRITVSMPRALLKDADRLARQLGVPSRSALVVEALRTLLARSHSQDVDASLDAYYGVRSQGEVAEERAMVRAFRRSRRRLDLDREGTG
jgi:metal-responsive CopG/Arc/MetJ family transcriptional regulator